MVGDKSIYYGEYLRLDRLLSCQEPETEAHDEMLFILVHQAYELWFKQILHELDAVLRVFGAERVEEKAVGRAVAHLERVVSIQGLLVRQLEIMETMTPLDFLDFRDALIPASGFQSVQFRLIENRLGMRPDDRVRMSGAPYTQRLSPEDRELLERAEAEPSLLDRLDGWLARTPFLRFGEFDFWAEYRRAVEGMLDRDREIVAGNDALGAAEREEQIEGVDATRAYFGALFDRARHEELVHAGEFRMCHEALQAALLINLYRDEPILHLPFRLLQALMDVDEGFTAWRYRHALMVQRMIGTKIGTGGSSGHDYLKRTAERHKVFGDLFHLSTYLIPRSLRPELPAAVREAMGYRFGAPGPTQATEEGKTDE